MQNNKLSVIIPVFNEAKTIAKAIAQIQNLPLQTELIVVDDCSTDGTKEILQDLKKTLNFKLILCDVNQGKGTAVRAGVAQATGDYFVVEDADLELDTKIIPGMFEKLKTNPGLDMINCYRVLPENKSLLIISSLARIMTNILMLLLYFRSTKDILCSYKMCKVAKFKGLGITSTRFGLESEWIVKAIKAHWNIIEMPVEYYPRAKKAGKKIHWMDGFDIIWQLISLRFQ